jgi:hypothetical protein
MEKRMNQSFILLEVTRNGRNGFRLTKEFAKRLIKTNNIGPHGSLIQPKEVVFINRCDVVISLGSIELSTKVTSKVNDIATGRCRSIGVDDKKAMTEVTAILLGDVVIMPHKCPVTKVELHCIEFLLSNGIIELFLRPATNELVGTIRLETEDNCISIRHENQDNPEPASFRLDVNGSGGRHNAKSRKILKRRFSRGRSTVGMIQERGR